MKEEIYNEKQVKAMEEEIRSMGVPYSAGEPDERYFANFRVHLLERIENREKKENVLQGIWAWLASWPLRSLSLGAGLAGIIAVFFVMQPATQAPVATLQPIQPKIENSSVVVPKEIKHPIAEVPKTQNIEPKQIRKTDLAQKGKKNTVLDNADKTPDVAMIDAIYTGEESDDPVNLEKLSESELESVIVIAENMK